MKFTNVLALVATVNAEAYVFETPDDGAASWDENNADEDATDCECIGVAAVPAAWAITDAESSTDCTATDDGDDATVTCTDDTDGDASLDTYYYTDDDFAAKLTAIGSAADYGDSCQNWDAETTWCDETDDSYDATTDNIEDYCDEDFIWCYTNVDCPLAVVTTFFENDASYNLLEFAQCNSASKILATMSAAIAAAVITM